jgi:hypothetical protein
VPFASCAVAVNCCLSPASMESELGVMLTFDTAPGAMVNSDVPLLPSAVAVIVAVPSLSR